LLFTGRIYQGVGAEESDKLRWRRRIPGKKGDNISMSLESQALV